MTGLIPRNHHFSMITRAIRRSETSVEIHRWYAGPRFGSIARVYQLTPASAARLAIISAGLRWTVSDSGIA
jgi:hypothetical protein